MTLDGVSENQPIKPISLIDQQLTYYSSFLSPITANHYFELLLKDINWQQETITLYGKKIKVPRLVGWHGDEGKSYVYSGVNHQPEAWTNGLKEIKELIENYTGHAFNSVLLNLYRNGQDSMGWHSDDEPELGDQPVIASVSLGAERLFKVRYKNDHQLNHDVRLSNGSILLMSGDLQRDWQHQIPKTKQLVTPRINLTFRQIL